MLSFCAQVIKENLAWLDKWCDYTSSQTQQQQLFFLSDATCRALRLTLHSTISLTEVLLSSGYRYVLTGKFGQDPLEVRARHSFRKIGSCVSDVDISLFQKFFGISRHVAGDGGQPTVQQFLYIYRMLSVNNLVKPPKRCNVSGQGPQLLLKLHSLFGKKSAVKDQVMKVRSET